MHENHNLFLFFMEINNMHRTRRILPIPRTCICSGAVFRDIGRQSTAGILAGWQVQLNPVKCTAFGLE